MEHDKRQLMAEHSRDEIYQRLELHGSQITEIAKGQAASDQKIAALEATVASGFQAISSEIKSLRPTTPNYIGWIGAGIALLTLFGGYTALVTFPMHTLIDRNYQHLELVHEHEAEIHGLNEKTEELKDDVDRLENSVYLSE